MACDTNADLQRCINECTDDYCTFCPTPPDPHAPIVCTDNQIDCGPSPKPHPNVLCPNDRICVATNCECKQFIT